MMWIKKYISSYFSHIYHKYAVVFHNTITKAILKNNVILFFTKLLSGGFWDKLFRIVLNL